MWLQTNQDLSLESLVIAAIATDRKLPASTNSLKYYLYMFRKTGAHTMLLYSSLGLYLVFLMNCHMPKLDVFCTNFIVMRYNTDFAIFSETACCNIISQ